MIVAMEDQSIEFLMVEDFRDCSKTTWGSLILPTFWALEQLQGYTRVRAPLFSAPSLRRS
jgi:hypothetical protein